MTIISRPLADRMLIVPNSAYFFGERRDPMRPLGIVHMFECSSLATIYLTELGAIGCEFHSGGPLASIPVLDSRANGLVPDEVMQNQDQVVQLQVNRVTFANFLAAAIFGRICERNNHRTLEGATYQGADAIFAFGRIEDQLLLPVQEQDAFLAAIAPKVRKLHRGEDRHYRFSNEMLADGEAAVRHLLQRTETFEYADLQSCIVMNYQAAILHNQQHAAASLALNIAVLECLVHEIFLAYGLVGDRSARSYASRGHSISSVSNSQFRAMRLQHRVNTLCEGGLIDEYLHSRIDAARIRRNSLMHGGERVSSRESGDCQTMVRDIWALLVDGPFALNAGWAYRY